MKIERNTNFKERVWWLIKLRWIAIGGVILAFLFVYQILKFDISFLPVFIIVLILIIYNSVFVVFLKYLQRNNKLNHESILKRIANIQIFFDYVSLALIIHFYGGIENPFIFYYIFHVIIASIVLSRKTAFFHATIGVFLFLFIVIFEYLEIIPHYCLKQFAPLIIHGNILYISSISFVFISTIYITVYMATSVSGKLKEKEKNLLELNELLKKKDRVKSKYVLRVTHDINGHLSTIYSCIDTVIKGFVGSLNEQQKDLLGRAYTRTDNLICFVSNLLEITGLKLNQNIKMEEFEISSVENDILKVIKELGAARNINVNMNIDPSLKKMTGIRVYIIEMFLNLLNNAIKYTPEGGEVNCHVDNENDHIIIEIKDNGIGIPKDEIPFIFDEFYRAKNVQKEGKKGTGLGLALVKQIVDMHKGKIRVESEEGKGTIFFIKLPQ